MLLPAELHTTQSTDDGERGQLRLFSEPALDRGDVRIKHRWRARTLDSMCCLVVQVKDGRVVSGKEHFFDLHNWDAFWA